MASVVGLEYLDDDQKRCHSHEGSLHSERGFLPERGHWYERLCEEV